MLGQRLDWEAQHALLRVTDQASPLVQIVRTQHQFARPRNGIAPEGGEFAVPADPVEQGLAEFGLERADAAAQCGLRQEQCRRRVVLLLPTSHRSGTQLAS